MAPPTAISSSKDEENEASLQNVLGSSDVETRSNGRPLRRTAGKRHNDMNFVNSTTAITDMFGDFVDQKSEEINRLKNSSYKKTLKKSLKRGRSPSPPPLNPVQVETESTLEEMEVNAIADYPSNIQIRPLQFVINVPLGFSGPMIFNIDSDAIVELANPSPLHKKRHRTQLLCQPESSQSAKKGSASGSNSKHLKNSGKKSIGFCDLPPEIRNTIYRHVFISKSEIQFSTAATNCKLSAAFLRTCKMVHQEGTGILYQENKFRFSRNKSARNPFWSSDNHEIGYLDMRHFLNMIGQQGRFNLREIHIEFEDSTRHYCSYHSHDIRYTADGNLAAAIKLIANDCVLYKLNLEFLGKSRTNVALEIAFLHNLCGMSADVVSISGMSRLEERCKNLLKNEIARQEKLHAGRHKKQLKKSRATW